VQTLNVDLSCLNTEYIVSICSYELAVSARFSSIGWPPNTKIPTTLYHRSGHPPNVDELINLLEWQDMGRAMLFVSLRNIMFDFDSDRLYTCAVPTWGKMIPI